MFKYLKNNIWQSLGTTITPDETYAEGYYFSDEVEQLHGTFSSYDEAEQALNTYSENL